MGNATQVHLARLSRLCRGWPQPCLRCVPANLVVFLFSPPLCCFPPDSLPHIITAILVQTPIPTQGASRGLYVISLGFCSVPRGCSHATQPNPMCHRNSRRYPPAMGLQQYSHAVPQLVSRLRSQSGATLSLAAHFFVSSTRYTSTYILRRTICLLFCCLLHKSVYRPARQVIVCCMYVLLLYRN